MRVLKDQFTRFFAAGFAAGALLVVATLGLGSHTIATPGLVTPAHAEAVR